MPEGLRVALSYGMPVGVLLGVGGAALVWWAWASVSPRTLVLALLAGVFVFEGGAPAVDEAAGVIPGGGFNLYGKGGGYLLFSFFEISVMAAGLAALLRRPLLQAFGAGTARPGGGAPAVATGSSPALRLMAAAYGLMALTVLWHLTQTLWTSPDSSTPVMHWLAQLGRPGVLFLLLQGLLVAAIVASVSDESEVRTGMALLMGLVGLRMVYGALRYLALGGDPRSAYELEAGSALRITFWDINDSLLACALGAWLMWHGASARHPLHGDQGVRPALSDGWRWTMLLGAMGCFAIAALSGRRAAQGGALLALLGLLLLLPRGRRWPAVGVLALALPLAAWKLRDRIDEPLHGLASPVAVLRAAAQTDSAFGDPRYRRFHELELAWETVQRQPLLGVGPAGAFEVLSPRGLEYHKGNYRFVHSGFGHVLLKTGFIGLALFLTTLCVALWVGVRRWREPGAPARDLLVVAAAGGLASLPTLWVGTPIIEIRTMLVMGFFLALPLVAARLGAHPQAHLAQA